MGDELYEGFDRVSAILDTYKAPQLVEWYIKVGKKEARRISTIATKIGSNADAWIRSDISGNKYPKLNSPEAENCIKAYQKWKCDYNIDVTKLKAGERLFDNETKVCGEPDILNPNESMVIDIKCSSMIRQSYWVQCDWYARHLNYSKKAVLRLNKNLCVYEYEVRDISDKDKEVFDALTKVYRYYNPIKVNDE